MSYAVPTVEVTRASCSAERSCQESPPPPELTAGPVLPFRETSDVVDGTKSNRWRLVIGGRLPPFIARGFSALVAHSYPLGRTVQFRIRHRL
jgi:hypothetical protein